MILNDIYANKISLSREMLIIKLTVGISYDTFSIISGF